MLNVTISLTNFGRFVVHVLCKVIVKRIPGGIFHGLYILQVSGKIRFGKKYFYNNCMKKYEWGKVA